MALTPEGTPYVESTDLVANYPAASLSLANRVDLVGVLPFATSAARATAIPSPTDGQYSYLQDTNATEFYNGSAWVSAGGGKILQVVSTAKTDTFTTSSSSLVDITGLSATITPSVATNKVLVTVHINANAGPNVSGTLNAVLVRNSTNIAIGDAAGSRLRRTFIRSSSLDATTIQGTLSMTFLDSPATTSATTYKIQIALTDGVTGYINRSGTDTDSANNARGISTITVMEVSA